MISHLDKLSQKGVGARKRQDIANSLKDIFYDVMVENQELRQKAERIVNNSNDSGGGESNRTKDLNMATAGSIIDNFGSDKADEQALVEQVARLQARVWALQSENELLNGKMMQMVQASEYKDHYIKTINGQLRIVLQDLQPRHDPMKGPASLSGLPLASPASANEDMSNHNSAPQKRDGPTRAE